MSRRPERRARTALGHSSSTRSSKSSTNVGQTRTTTLHKERRHLVKPRYAYFTLVMCGDEYVVGAVVLGWSLRKHGVKHDLVAMVTHDVTVKARKLLMKVYDRVVRVRYIDSKTESVLRRYREDRPWIKHCLTKANVLQFVEYDKIIWLDADMLVEANPDVLFLISAPAGICTSIRDHARWHGHLVPEQEIKESLLNNYGIKGCIMVLEPSTRHFLMATSQHHTGHGNVYLGPDEYFFTMLYKNSWHHLDQRFGCSAVHESNGVQPVVLHFDRSKPWRTRRDQPAGWHGHNRWWDTARDLVAHHPEMGGLFSAPCDDRTATTSRSWVFLSPAEKVSFKLKNDYQHRKRDEVAKF